MGIRNYSEDCEQGLVAAGTYGSNRVKARAWGLDGQPWPKVGTDRQDRIAARTVIRDRP